MAAIVSNDAYTTHDYAVDDVKLCIRIGVTCQEFH